jgi:hypothetical protein
VVYFAVVFNGLDAIVVFCHIDMALPKKAGKPLINEGFLGKYLNLWAGWLAVAGSPERSGVL